MKANLTPISTGITELELFAETPDERVALETIRTSGFCNSHNGDRNGTVAVYVTVLSPDFEKELLAFSRQTVGALDGVRAFLTRLPFSSTEAHLLAGTDVRITHTEDTPTCPDCGANTTCNGAVFDCLNCGTRVGG